MKWHNESGHLNKGDMLTSEQHRYFNEKRNFSAEFKRESAQQGVDQNYTVADAAKAMDVGLFTMTRWIQKERGKKKGTVVPMGTKRTTGYNANKLRIGQPILN